MLHLVTPSIGRVAEAAQYWPEVRKRAGADLFWTIVICHCPNDPSAQDQLAELSKKYADQTIVCLERVSNGRAIQVGIESMGLPESFMKIDADVLPSWAWASLILKDMDQWQDGKLGAISALPPWAPRHAVGPRRTRQCYGQMVLYSPVGVQAIGDHSKVATLHGDHDPLTFRQFTKAGLWQAYTHNAWWVKHNEIPTRQWAKKIDPYTSTE